MKKTAPIFVIIAATLWGVDGIILRPALYSLPVPTVVFIESIIVALLLTPFFIKAAFRLPKTLSINDWLSFFIVALLGGAIGSLAITKALFSVNFVHLSVVILIQKLQPVFALLLAGILLKEKLGKKFFLWSGLAIIGAYIMTFGIALPNFDTGENTLEAALYALLAAFSFGSSTVFSKRALKNIGFELGTYLRYLFTTIIVFLIVLSFGDMSSIQEVTTTQFWIFIIIAFSTGGPALFLYYYGLKHIRASVATIGELAFPLTAVILDYFVHGSVLNLFQWIGIGILMYSIFKVTNLDK